MKPYNGIYEYKIIDQLRILQDDKTIHKATQYISSTWIVKLTRVGKSRKVRTEDYRLTIGAPNYAERQYIKKLQKAGEPFPVKKIHVKYYPKKR